MTHIFRDVPLDSETAMDVAKDTPLCWVQNGVFPTLHCSPTLVPAPWGSL